MKIRMYYPDLTPYSYFRDVNMLQTATDEAVCRLYNLVNIGWLDNRHEFGKGCMSELFLEELFSLCLKPFNQMRGFHVCELCLYPPSTPMKLKRDGQEIIVDIPRHMIAERAGQKAWLGSAEIRIIGVERKMYVAPTMIYHYVADHNYLPPDEFINAVLASRHSASS